MLSSFVERSNSLSFRELHVGGLFLSNGFLDCIPVFFYSIRFHRISKVRFRFFPLPGLPRFSGHCSGQTVFSIFSSFLHIRCVLKASSIRFHSIFKEYIQFEFAT